MFFIEHFRRIFYANIVKFEQTINQSPYCNYHGYISDDYDVSDDIVFS